MKIEGTWGYSHDEEMYSGFFATREEAIAEGGIGREGSTIWVGQFRAPDCESYLDYSLLIDHVVSQDDYSGDWAEDCISPTKEQAAELTAELRVMFARWLDKHNLRPGFGIIENSEAVWIPSA